MNSAMRTGKQDIDKDAPDEPRAHSWIEHDAEGRGVPQRSAA